MSAIFELQPLEPRQLLSTTPITFAPIANYHSGLTARHLVAGDFNHDGYDDLAVVNTDPDSNSISILMNNGNGTFAAPVLYRLTYSTDKTKLGPENIAVGDFNGDGNLDLAIVTRNPQTNATNLIADQRVHDGLTLLFGNGDGTFGNQTQYRIIHGTRAIAVADLNGDGKPDLIIAALRNVGVVLNDGNGVFSTETLLLAGAGKTSSISTGDLTGNGLTDIVATKGSDNSVRIFYNQGNGTFGAGERVGVDGVAIDATIGDFNGDGVPDIAVANSQFRQGITLLTNEGNGNYTREPEIKAPAFLESIVAVDLNGDGNLDLATVDFTSSVRTLLGNGDGTFANAIIQPGGNEGYYLIAADFNDDGKIDLAWTRHNRVNILLNTTP